jgi:quinolinate synthase
MPVVASLAEEIQDLKRERNAIVLAHHYQESEIQELADSIGDSLELARKAREFAGEVIVFCGVYFMAETAKILNPEKTVVVPDAEAGCSLVDSCSAEHVVVSYINTSAAVKAESDLICTSRNAVQVVNSIPADQPVLFLPDVNLGNYVKKESGRQNMKIWQGACIVHATFPSRRLVKTMAEHPNALVVAHPECPADVLAHADYIGSTSALIEWIVKHPHNEFIVMTESGVKHSLLRRAAGKQCWFVENENCNCSECPYMKKNTLEKIRDCMRDLTPAVELPEALRERARLPIERMLAL